MVNIPVSKPTLVKLLTIAAGVATVIVAHFAPHYSVLLGDILQVLGIGAIGAGGVTIAQGAPHAGEGAKSGSAIHVPNREDGQSPPDTAALSVYGFLALQLRKRRLVMWSAPALLLLLACDPRKPPCDETKLRAIDIEYSAAVVSKCLAKYDAKEDCPAFAGLQAKHSADLKAACPQ